MTKIAMITDTHCGVRNNSTAFHDYQQKSYHWFFDYIDKLDIQCVVHLGDMFDNRKNINMLSLKRVREDFIVPLHERRIETHVIQGNHDSYYRNTHEVNALTELVDGRYDTIKTYSVPTIINIDGLDIQIMPWITESNEKQAMDAINSPRAPILMGHLELRDFTMFSGAIATDGLDRGVFNKFDHVYSGHYHHRSTLDNVSYVGAFAQYSWSDYNDPRGFSIYDTDTRKIEFIQNPHTMFMMTNYDDRCDDDIIAKINRTDFSVFTDNYVKINCTGKNNPYAFDLFYDSVYRAGPLDIQVIENGYDVDSVEVDQSILPHDTRSLISAYIDGIPLNSLNPNKLKAFMYDLLEQANGAVEDE